MSSTKRYWQDLAELDPSSEVAKGRANEFSTPLPLDEMLADTGLTGATTGRRDFLKFLGFSLTAATLAACEAPVIKSIPYVNKPEDITPGVANWYASTYYDGEDFASVLVKTREGRPIHIKGNTRFGINRDPKLDKGSINARINSSVITLYDNARLHGPSTMQDGKPVQHIWADADKAIGAEIAKAKASGKRIVLLTNTVISPSVKAAIDNFKLNVGGSLAADGTSKGVDHIQYDTISYAGITGANQKSFGKRVFPSYDLTKASVVVGIGADFLSNWGSSTENTWQYATRRRPLSVTPAMPMSRHWQFESRMSLTGANADERIAMKVSQAAAVVMGLHDAIAKQMGGTASGASGLDGDLNEHVAKCAAELVAAKGASLVLCGSNDEGTQVLVNSINAMLGNYGSTIDLVNHSNFHQGDDAAVAQLVKDMNAGNVGALLIANVNPAYSLPNANEFKEGLKKVGLSVSFSGYADETASRCNWITPDNHWLESWNDFMPKPGHFATAQPTIRPLFDTRQFPETLLRLSGVDKPYHEFMQGVWQASMPGIASFTLAWDQTIHDGVYEGTPSAAEAISFAGNIGEAAAATKKSMDGAGDWQLELYTKEGIGSGLHANNPWLQEMPDPISKATWDNYVCMSPADLMELVGAKKFTDLYIGEQDPAHVVKVTVNGKSLELPAVVSPGQAPRTISVALGYGRGAEGESVGRAACLRNDDNTPAPVGQNAYPWTTVTNGTVNYSALNVTVERTGSTYPLALTQTQMTDMDRESIVKETTFTVWALHEPRETYNELEKIKVHRDINHDGVVNAKDEVPTSEVDLWAAHPVEEVGHRWGMSIDLNSCIGCGACVTACNSENNIAVVGKDQVRRSREMHWLRIDRYYSSDMTNERGHEEHVGKIERYAEMEVPSASPKVIFIPVMCQHCNHAPCETVCPVAATTHSNEGLNMMAYNRCIGTRYCANNCPYKVRRFNWFNYVTEDFGQVNPAWDELGRMVLNPDVVVRGRGVIEKCSMCVQQIQAGKLNAKKAGTPVKDGDIQTACSAACGTGAIIFGDLNDKKSMVRAGADDERSYYMLEEIGTQPNVNYLTKVRNTAAEEAHHA